MELTHRFTVPSPVAETWERFQDIAALAECFPGAQVTSVEGDTFTGTVKVKLGPIALVYAGSGTFVEKDVLGRRLVVEAKGRDKRGNGTAGATATLTMDEAPEDGSSTAVQVHTDLAITGKPAQFGRGVLQDVSDKLLGQFVACLEKQSAPEPAAVAAAPATPSADGSAGVAADPAIARMVGPSDAGTVTGATAAGTTGAMSEDALNLGATVLPVLVRSYWKPALAGLAVVLVLVRVLSRSR